jgi:hypothetical protein
MSQSIRETTLQNLFDQVPDYANDFEDFENVNENNNVIILPNTPTPTPTPTPNSTIVEEEIDLSRPLVPPIFEIPEGCIEHCPICFEQVDGVNISVSTCGHVFHCYCLLRAVKKNSCCPLCRHPLINTEHDNDDDDNYDDLPHLVTDTDTDTDDSDSDSNTNTNSTESENESQVTLEQLANKMIALGYTMADLLYVITPITSHNPNHTDEFYDKIFDTIDNIKNQTLPLSQRDNRSYSQVVVGTTNTEVVVSVSNNIENINDEDFEMMDTAIISNIENMFENMNAMNRTAIDSLENMSDDLDVMDRRSMLIQNFTNSIERRGLLADSIIQNEYEYGIRLNGINWN